MKKCLNCDVFKELINSLSLQLMVPAQITWTFITLQQRLKQHNSVVIKADKGKALIIHDCDTYEKEILCAMLDNNTYVTKFKFSIFLLKDSTLLPSLKLLQVELPALWMEPVYFSRNLR